MHAPCIGNKWYTDCYQITLAIGDEIRDTSNLNDLNDTFDNTRNRVRGNMNRMLQMAERTGVGWRVWLVFFVAVIFIFAYVWVTWLYSRSPLLDERYNTWWVHLHAGMACGVYVMFYGLIWTMLFSLSVYTIGVVVFILLSLPLLVVFFTYVYCIWYTFFIFSCLITTYPSM